MLSPEHESDALRERNSVFKTCASCPFCKKVDALSEPVGAAKVEAAKRMTKAERVACIMESTCSKAWKAVVDEGGESRKHQASASGDETSGIRE